MQLAMYLVWSVVLVVFAVVQKCIADSVRS